MNKKWYAVYVNSRHEKKVAGLLDNKLIENYLPLQKVQKQWSDRKKIVEEPLFRSYVFVHINENEMSTVREINGVLNFVYWLGKPAIIKATEIEIIKEFISEYENIEVETFIPNLNSSVKIENGPFVNQIGKIVKIKNNRVKILIESLGFYLIADISKNKVLVLPTVK